VWERSLAPPLNATATRRARPRRGGQTAPLAGGPARALTRLLLGEAPTARDVAAVDPVFFEHRFAAVLAPGGVAATEAALCAPLRFVSARGWDDDDEDEGGDGDGGTVKIDGGDGGVSGGGGGDARGGDELVRSSAPRGDGRRRARRGGGRELCAGGAARRVTEENKLEYVTLLAEDFLLGDVRREVSRVRSRAADNAWRTRAPPLAQPHTRERRANDVFARFPRREPARVARDDSEPKSPLAPPHALWVFPTLTRVLWVFPTPSRAL